MKSETVKNQLTKAIQAVAELLPDTNITIVISGRDDKGFFRRRGSNTDRESSFQDMRSLLNVEKHRADFGTPSNN
jgi:hypothetical protein